MKVEKLGQFLQLKYGLTSHAAVNKVPPAILEAAKKEIKNAYNLYANPKTAKQPVIKMAADAEMPYIKELQSHLEKFVINIDDMSPVVIFNRANTIAHEIAYIANYHKSNTRETLHDKTRAIREPERNYRELIKSKLGLALSPLSSLFVNAIRILGKALEKNPSTFAGKVGEPPAKVMGKNEIRQFMLMYPNEASKYGLVSEEVWQRALQANRRLIEQFIRAVKKGVVPTTGLEVKKLTDAIRAGIGYQPMHMEEEEPVRAPQDMFQYPEEEPIAIDPDDKADPVVLDPMEEVRKQEQIKQEDAKKKQWEQQMISKYNNDASLYDLFRKV